ncbi:Catalyzes the synthesis of activated sulfate (By similarity) [Musa troglodytarum]|uniref:Adenylyl-sulfate kinase n=1 Tax=Musa troglodytarum TaxID=320322 RepID=A0A9E7FKG3_9LILI|nr:Catalyzes the synthesis of activated sulfate (By similarity) [Musa troglodytarum]
MIALPAAPPLSTKLGFRGAVVPVGRLGGRRSAGAESARLGSLLPRMEAASPWEEPKAGFMRRESEPAADSAKLRCGSSAAGWRGQHGGVSLKHLPVVSAVLLHVICSGASSLSTVGKSTNIVWHECPIGKLERQKLLNQKGCVIWITGLSGSGKSTLACALSRELHHKGYLTYVLDGDNIRHGLNRDLSFNGEDRAENIRRIGEVAKLFADSGVICIASLISPFRKERDACRAMLPDSSFIEVFLNIPLEVCEARDPKGLYKLAQAGKIKGFTGIDDPYEPPLDCEIVIQQKGGQCPTPKVMAEQVMSFLDQKGFLQT